MQTVSGRTAGTAGVTGRGPAPRGRCYGHQPRLRPVLHAGKTLEERIASGEFGDTGGSTKEKITRPVRKMLAQEPTGFGEHPPPQLAIVLAPARPACRLWVRWPRLHVGAVKARADGGTT